MFVRSHAFYRSIAAWFHMRHQSQLFRFHLLGLSQVYHPSLYYASGKKNSGYCTWREETAFFGAFLSRWA